MIFMRLKAQVEAPAEAEVLASEVFFCRLYGNSARPKSQGLPQNNLCLAVDKEKGARATARCL